MIEKSTIKFLQDLRTNNNRDWFEANRARYLEAKSDMENLTWHLIKGLSEQDPEIAESNLTIKQCTFRIYRDVRFSEDKTPYKVNMGASFNIGGKKVHNAGYYFHLENKNIFLAGGVWMPESRDLKLIRDKISMDYNEFKQILNNKSFVKYFPKGIDREASLKKVPKGFNEFNPAVEYLKLKSFTIYHFIPLDLIFKKELIKYILTGFKAMQPLIKFLNGAVIGMEK
jgi:uncharacterized protein (TIGR02453 family)